MNNMGKPWRFESHAYATYAEARAARRAYYAQRGLPTQKGPNMYYTVNISPHHAGFGMWQRGEANGEPWAATNDMLQAINDAPHVRAYPVRLEDGAELPEGAEDMRGHIYNEPDEVYVLVTDHGIEYFGIIEVAHCESCEVVGELTRATTERDGDPLCDDCAREYDARQTRIGHFCAVCGNEVDDACQEHPDADIDLVEVPQGL